MPFALKVGGVWKSSTTHLRVGGVWKKCSVWLRVGGVWKKVSSTFSVTISPSNIQAYQPSGTVIVSVAANVSGGVGPYTYQWTDLTPGSGLTIVNATSQTASFRCASSADGTARVTVTDTGNGNAQTSADVNYSMANGSA